MNWLNIGIFTQANGGLGQAEANGRLGQAEANGRLGQAEANGGLDQAEANGGLDQAEAFELIAIVSFDQKIVIKVPFIFYTNYGSSTKFTNHVT